MTGTTRAAIRKKARRRAGAPFAARRINLFYLPAILLFLGFTIYPLVNGFILSLSNWNGDEPLANFLANTAPEIVVRQ